MKDTVNLVLSMEQQGFSPRFLFSEIVVLDSGQLSHGRIHHPGVLKQLEKFVIEPKQHVAIVDHAERERIVVQKKPHRILHILRDGFRVLLEIHRAASIDLSGVDKVSDGQDECRDPRINIKIQKPQCKEEHDDGSCF